MNFAANKTILAIIAAIVIIGGTAGILVHNHNTSVHNAMMHSEQMKKVDEANAMKQKDVAAAMKKEEAAKAAQTTPTGDAMMHDTPNPAGN